MISVANLTYEYPDKRALEDVSFEVKEGAIAAMVGPNGAGKTTLLRAIAALSKPLAGDVLVNGYSAVSQPREVHLHLGYLSDFFGLYDSLTVRQSLQFIAYSRLESNANFDSAIATAIERSGVQSFLDKKNGTLSRGMRQRVGIAQAIIHQPKVLLLDEPAAGLDPEARHELSKLLLLLRDSGMTIIVSSHILAELEEYSSEMLMIQDGKVIEHRKLKGVVVLFKNMTISLEIMDERFTAAVQQLEGVKEVVPNGRQITLKLDEQILSKRKLLQKLLELQIPVEEFGEQKVNLQEEYIRTLTQYKQSKS